MEGTRGIHAATAFLICGIFYALTYTQFSALIGNITDTLYRTVFWMSYIFLIITTMFIIPYLIALSNQPESSIKSIFMALGFYTVGALMFRMLNPLFEYLIGTDHIAGIITHGLTIQILSVIWILMVILLLFIAPAMVGIMPNTLWNMARGEE